jgi:pilus assembly protein FimV
VPSVGEQPDVTISEPEPVVTIQTEPTEPPRVADADAAEPAPEQQPVAPPAADITTVFQQLQDDPIGTLNQLRRDPLMLASAGGGLVALLLLLWLVVRFKRRGEEEAGVYDELLADETTPTESGIAKRQPADKKSDTKPVIDETPTREQPLKRINFLIAGGSYREAENALRLLMVEHADDPELQLKLLEIYYRSGDTEKFVETAETLQQQLGDAPDHPLWQSAVRMGNELSPGHPLFNQTDDADTLVFNPLESSAGREATPSSASTEAPQTQGHSPRLVFPGEPRPESAGEQQTDVTQVLQPQSTQNDAGQPATSETEPDDTMVFAKPQPLRFTQDADERRSLDKPSTPTSDRPASQDNFDTYFASELPSVSDVYDDERSSSSKETETFSELTLDDLPELDAGTDAEQQEAIEIKLDLAQAYLDMDDQAGAKALLQEVQREGNVVQQERAQAILRRLS